MIENFSKHTQPLTELEQMAAPLVLDLLNDTPKTAAVLAKAVNDYYEKQHEPTRLTEVTVRKIISKLRHTGAHGICSSSDGFWKSTSIMQIQSQIESLTQRAQAIQATRDGVQKYYDSLVNKTLMRYAAEQIKLDF
jgi:hypothetical protein